MGTPNWLALSQQPSVVSIVHDGNLYTSGHQFARTYPPGALDKLFDQLGHGKPAVISVNEEEHELYADALIKSFEHAGWTFTNVRPSGSNLSLWFGPGDLPTFDHMIGASNNGGSESKDNAKRNGVMSPLNSPHQGAFVSQRHSELETVFLTDGTECQCLTITLPDGEQIRALAIPDNPDATDGDMLVSADALLRMTKASEIQFSPEDLITTDAVQLLTLARPAGIKAMGQHGGRIPWPERFEGFDLVVGRPGLLTKTQRQITAGKLTLLMEPEDILGYIPADGLESVPNCYLNFHKASDMARYQRLVLIKDIWRRQLKALDTDDDLSDWHPPAERDEDQLLEKLIWQRETDDKRTLGRLARELTGSVFAHPEALGAAVSAPLRLVRSAIEKGEARPMPSKDRSRRPQGYQRPKGLPYVILPGFTLKRAYHEFAGVDEPVFGSATILWRTSGTPYAFVLNAQQYADPDEFIRHNGADGDDHWTSTMGIRYDGEPHLILVRPPNSPDNGNAYRVSPKDLERWKRVAPVLPLKAEWHQIEHPSQVQSKLDMGPSLTPPAPTRDLEVKMRVARIAVNQKKVIGSFANKVQALSMSGYPIAALNFNGSAIPDNVYLQDHDNAYPDQQLDDMCIEWDDQNNTWFEPAATRVAYTISQILGAQEPPKTPKFSLGKYPDYEFLWDELLDVEDILDIIDATAKYRCNGYSEQLTARISEPVTLLAARTVAMVRNLWKADFRAQRQIRYRKGLRPRVRRRLMDEAKVRTLDAIRRAVEDAYQQSLEARDRPGEFAVALNQAAILFAYRWEKPDNPSYRVPASQRWLPKRPYALLHYLPETEQEALYTEDNGFQHLEPTWIARLTFPANGVKPEVGRYYTAQRDGPRWVLIPEEGGETVAFLQSEGYGLAGMTSELIGVMPRQRITQKMPDFCVQETVAVFRQDQTQVRRQIQRNYAAAADRLREAQAEL